MLTEESLAALVQDFQALLLEIDNMFRLTKPAVSDEERRVRLKAQMELREEVQLDLGRGDYTTANLGLEVVIARSGRKLDELERRQLAQALMRAGIDASLMIEARHAGDFSAAPRYRTRTLRLVDSG